MKRCPACQRDYADDSLRFCLQDGTALESVSSVEDDFKTWVLPENSSGLSDPAATEAFDLTADTVIHPRPSAPTLPNKPRETTPVTTQLHTDQPKTRSTAMVIGLTVVATLALLALGGGGAWLLLRDSKETAQREDNAGNVNATRARDNQNDTPANANARTPSNINAKATPTPAATPAPPPTNPSAEVEAVRAALDGWLDSFRARDIDSYMARYASVLEAYYLARNVGVERVRGDKERAFAKYTTIEVWLSNVQVQVDTSGTRAVATFNKSWRFTAPGVNPFTGSGANRFTFRKIGGQWLIVGEEDISS